MVTYSFKAEVWKYKGPAGWYFVSVPKLLSKKIRSNHGLSEEGWGRLKTTATVGKSKWKTAIWYDSKAQGYLLPIKAMIRKKEQTEEGEILKIQLEFAVEKEERRLGQWLTKKKS